MRPDKGEAAFIVSGEDVEKMRVGEFVRLMGLFNIEITQLGSGEIHARFHSKSHQEARELHVPFVHWLPANVGIEARVVMPDASTASGVAGEGCRDLKEGTMIQFERFGFVRVDSESPFVAYYAHR